MQQLIVLFPAVAAWLIVALLSLIGLGAAWAGRKFAGRMDDQDATLKQIRDLLASEIGKLREMHHDIEKRVVWLEAQNDNGPKYGRRREDQHAGGE